MTLWIVLVIAAFFLACALVLPRRFRAFLNDLCLVPVQLARDLVAACESYIRSFTATAGTVLRGVGIEDHFVERSAGGLVTFALGIAGLLAELEIAALSFSALGFGDMSASVIATLGISAVDAMAVILVVGGAAWGIVALDLGGLTHFLPLGIPPASVAKRLLSAVTLLAFGGCAASAVVLAKFRAAAMSTSPDASVAIPVEIVWTLGFLAVLTLATGTLCLATLPATGGALVVLVLAVVLVPAGLGWALGRVTDRLITVVFNLLLALITLVTGLLGGLVGRPDDTVGDTADVAPAPAPQVAAVAPAPVTAIPAVPAAPAAPADIAAPAPAGADPGPAPTPAVGPPSFDPLA